MTIEPVKVELGPEPVAIGIVISDSDACKLFVIPCVMPPPV